MSIMGCETFNMQLRRGLPVNLSLKRLCKVRGLTIQMYIPANLSFKPWNEFSSLTIQIYVAWLSEQQVPGIYIFMIQSCRDIIASQAPQFQSPDDFVLFFLIVEAATFSA